MTTTVSMTMTMAVMNITITMMVQIVTANMMTDFVVYSIMDVRRRLQHGRVHAMIVSVHLLRGSVPQQTSRGTAALYARAAELTMPLNDEGKPKGIAFVQFKDEEERSIASSKPDRNGMYVNINSRR